MASKSNANGPADAGSQDTVLDPLPEGVVGTGRALVPGTMLEEYEIQRVLSESGFAVVYLAMDHTFDRLVVIKEYQPSTLAEHSDKSRAELRGPAHATAFKRGKYAFMSESRMLATCDHPSLLRVNRIWDANGTIYRVMPYYFGKNLQVTRQAAPQAPDEASLRALLDGLLGALAALHEQDCVHGAVSPEKILLLADDRPVLMDFGAVRRAIVSPETQRLIASLEPSYLAPEQIEPAPPELVPGPWSDLYSVAAVLYFCIAGDLPKRSKREPITKVVRRLQQRQPGLHYSAALLQCIDATLADNPHERPSTVAEFLLLLDGPPSADSSPAPATAESAPLAPAAFSASDDMVNVQGRVVPFARRKESTFQAPPAAAPGRIAPMPVHTTQDESAVQPVPSRLFPSLEEMMAESEERVVAEMRRERAKVQFPEAGPIRPQSKRLPRWALGLLGAMVVLAGLGWGGWKLQQQHKTDDLLSAAALVAPAAATRDAQPLPPPIDTSRDSPGFRGSRTVPPAPSVNTPQPAGVVITWPSAPPAPPLQAAVMPSVPEVEISMAPPAAGYPAVLPVEEAPVKPVKEPASPREVCGERADFALYNCMQTQCARGRWTKHPQCARLRDTDEVIR